MFGASSELGSVMEFSFNQQRFINVMTVNWNELMVTITLFATTYNRKGKITIQLKYKYSSAALNVIDVLGKSRTCHY